MTQQQEYDAWCEKRAAELENRKCPDCGGPMRISWNGRCLDCHEASCRFSLNGDCAPEGFDPADAGERWDEDY